MLCKVNLSLKGPGYQLNLLFGSWEKVHSLKIFWMRTQTLKKMIFKLPCCMLPRTWVMRRLSILIRFPANARRQLGEEIKVLVDIHGLQLMRNFVVLEPGRARIRKI